MSLIAMYPNIAALRASIGKRLNHNDLTHDDEPNAYEPDGVFYVENRVESPDGYQPKEGEVAEPLFARVAMRNGRIEAVFNDAEWEEELKRVADEREADLAAAIARDDAANAT